MHLCGKGFLKDEMLLAPPQLPLSPVAPDRRQFFAARFVIAARGTAFATYPPQPDPVEGLLVGQSRADQTEVSHPSRAPYLEQS